VLILSRKSVSASVNIELYERLQAMAKATRRPLSVYWDEAIEYLLKKYENVVEA